MKPYGSIRGTVIDIESGQANADGGCSLRMAVATADQGVVNFTVTGDTYVPECKTINPGDRVTAFYDLNVPVPLIYPPLYQAVVMVKENLFNPQQYELDYFDYNLINSDSTLRLDIAPSTLRLLPNGQVFNGNIAEKLLLVSYRMATRSIPAITTPDQVIVFC